MGRIQSHRHSDERYPTLRIVGAVFTWGGAVLLVVGMILLAFGLIGLLGFAMDVPRVRIGGTVAAIWSLGFLAAGLQSLAMGAFCRLAIHVEENTRAAAQVLEKLQSRLEPRAEGIGSIFRS